MGAHWLNAQDSTNVGNNTKEFDAQILLKYTQDSLVTTFQNKLDSLQSVAIGLLDHNNDSIATLQQKYLEKVNHYIDYLNTKLHELKSYADVPEEKVRALENKVQTRIDSISKTLFEETKIDQIDKLDGFSELDIKEQLDLPKLDPFDMTKTLDNLQLDNLQGQSRNYEIERQAMHLTVGRQDRAPVISN